MSIATRSSTPRPRRQRRPGHRTQFSFRATDRRAAADSADAHRQQRRRGEEQGRRDDRPARAGARHRARDSRTHAWLRSRRRHRVRLRPRRRGVERAGDERRQVVFDRMDWSAPEPQRVLREEQGVHRVGGWTAGRRAHGGSDSGDVQRQRRADANAGAGISRRCRAAATSRSR